MKFGKIILVLLLSLGWIGLLSFPIGNLPPMGNFLDPVVGFWANAESPSSTSNNFHPLSDDEVLQRVSIVFDDRLVPHIKASNDYDLYYAQGYIQAYYRLWQMDMQTRAAAGNLSEVVGEKTLNYDRGQRRKGMVWAAEKFVSETLKDGRTKTAVEAYTAGVNAYIHSIKDYKHLPLEYKLMNFKPKDWELINAGLLIKMMADGLTGASNDLGMSYLRQALSPDEIAVLFPDQNPNSDPVIPKGTAFPAASLRTPQENADSLYAHLPQPDTSGRAISMSLPTPSSESGIGSNNWVLDGQKTTTGYPILCNDPHLSLSLPSIWYEIQLTAPGINCYGVTIPGAPGVVIGFNDSISWGFTNNYRDVKDFYALRLSPDKKHYWYDGQQRDFTKRIESIQIKGEKQPYLDTVLYTVYGPVEYDPSFPDPAGTGLDIAMAWMAHRPSNELLSIYLLNRAHNYPQFVSGVQYFTCPAQNFIYGDCSGNIAIWGQGQFIDKWKGQGKYIMRGDTSATLWGAEIPVSENPHSLNPAQHYLESANQQVTDNTYPYWYNGSFMESRSWAITKFLQGQKKFSVTDMEALQNNNWTIFAEKAMPLFKKFGTAFGQIHPDYFKKWNDSLSPGTKTGAAFRIWYDILWKNLWKNKFDHFPIRIYPSRETTLALMSSDTNELNRLTGTSFSVIAQASFTQTADSLKQLAIEDKIEWYQIKNTSIIHLSKLPAFSFSGLKIGGDWSAINATQENHGPSWRMIVSLKPGKVEAWGTYPGGQSGNPGSPYYNSFLQNWINGKYDKIQFFQPEDYATHSKNKTSRIF